MRDRPMTDKPLSVADYERMAMELETMADKVRQHPEMNHHFAERLTLIAKQMREDSMRLRPLPKGRLD